MKYAKGEKYNVEEAEKSVMEIWEYGHLRKCGKRRF